MEMSHIREFLSSWPAQNTLVAAMLLALAAVVWYASKREYWRLAYREVRHRSIAVISFWILVAYSLVALLDSIGWCRPAVNQETGEILRNAETGEVLYDAGHSALDYLLGALRTSTETTYSAPLATMESGVKGKPLKYPRRHLLGTDRIGGDVLFQALKSIRTGMIIGLLTTMLAVPFALFLGIVSGYFGGWIDDVLQFICVVFSSIPTILFIAAFMLIFGQGLPQLCLAMGIASWTGLYRLLRGETMRLREAEFVQAAVGLGIRRGLILLRHIVPNVLHLVLITAVLRFSSEVLAEAALTYLGIGVGADTMSWGTMINDARTELTRTPIVWWKLTAAFTFMLGLVLPANLFGDAVRDALDPRLRTQ